MPIRRFGYLSATPARRSTHPPTPNESSGLPLPAISEKSRPSSVPRKSLLFFPSDQYAAPRLMNRLADSVRSSLGSKLHSSFPVSGSSAMSRENGVVTYITPSTTSGVASNALRVGQRVPSLRSPVWKIQAGRKRFTLLRSISFSFEYFVPPASPA